jgi:hypothetical protein
MIATRLPVLTVPTWPALVAGLERAARPSVRTMPKPPTARLLPGAARVTATHAEVLPLTSVARTRNA